MRSFLFVLINVLLVSFMSDTALAVSIEDLRIAFEEKKGHVLVREMVALMPGEQDTGEGDPDFEIPLPAGAKRAQVVEQDGETELLSSCLTAVLMK